MSHQLDGRSFAVTLRREAKDLQSQEMGMKFEKEKYPDLARSSKIQVAG